MSHFQEYATRNNPPEESEMIAFEEKETCPFCDEEETEYVEVMTVDNSKTKMCKTCYEYPDFAEPYKEIQRIIRKEFDTTKNRTLKKEIIYMAEHTQIQGVYLPKSFIKEMEDDLNG